MGVPAFTGQLLNHDSAQVNGGGIDFLPRNSLALPYIQNWSAGLQYQAPHNILLEANYVGSKGTRLFEGNLTQNFNIDQAPVKYLGLGDMLNDDLAADLANPATSATLAQWGITKLPFPSFENNPLAVPWQWPFSPIPNTSSSATTIPKPAAPLTMPCN